MTKQSTTGLSAGDVRTFSKSGNEVRLIARSGKDNWRVERTQGASKGKTMICPGRALIHPQAMESTHD